MNRISLKKLKIKISSLEKRFEQLPKALQALFFIYTILIAIIFGIVLGVVVNCQNLKEIKNSRQKTLKLEKESIDNILKRVDQK